jgi:hypothetical protein
MRRLSIQAAFSCAYARKPKCKCRCGGVLHGKGNHALTTEDIIGQLEEQDLSGGLDGRGKTALARLRETLKVQETLV